MASDVSLLNFHLQDILIRIKLIESDQFPAFKLVLEYLKLEIGNIRGLYDFVGKFNYWKYRRKLYFTVQWRFHFIFLTPNTRDTGRFTKLGVGGKHHKDKQLFE